MENSFDPSNYYAYNPSAHINPNGFYYNIPNQPDLLYEYDEHKDWSRTLRSYAGNSYLAGAFLGGTKGVIEGLKAAERGDSMKIRVNRVLNTSGQIGGRVGNRLGVLGLTYALLETGVKHKRDTDDWKNIVYAGLGTGALYKAASSAGLRGVVGGSLAGALVAGAVVVGKQFAKRFVHI